jgi:hypothetical protein
MGGTQTLRATRPETSFGRISGEPATAPPGEDLMAARLVSLCVCVFAAVVPSAWAADLVEVVSAVAPDDSSRIVEPRISPRVARRNRDQITTSFQVALDRVLEVPECRAMFSELGADALTTLGRVSFYPIGSHELKPNVCNGSVVHTLVGGGPIWVCRKFSRLSNSQGAMVIIHEALHHAGLTEHPQDKSGMTSAGINAMVAKRCGL